MKHGAEKCFSLRSTGSEGLCYTEFIMFDHDVLIIGAGMAGLTCGCLLAQKGLHVLILEKNDKIGGCCSSFEKEGFSFDLSVQSLGECQEGGRIWNLLKRLDLLDQIHFLPLSQRGSITFRNRESFSRLILKPTLKTSQAFFRKRRKGLNGSMKS